MLATMQKDGVPLNYKRQKMSPSQLQQVNYLHLTADKPQLPGFPCILQSLRSKHWSVRWAVAGGAKVFLKPYDI